MNSSSAAYEQYYEYQPDAYVKNVNVKHKKKLKAATKRKQLIFVLSILYVAVLTGTLLVRTVKISEASSKLSSLKNEYTQLVNQNKQLEVEINTKIDLKKVEEIAIAKLDMNTPLKNQIVYLNAASQNYGEIITDESVAKKKSAGIMAIIKSFTGFFAYSN